MKFREFFNSDLSVNWDKIESLSCFEKLSHTPQSATWHKEGDCLIHTKKVTEQMENVLFQKESVERGDEVWFMCMVAAICHDLGKGETTVWSEEKSDYTTKNHGVVGERITRNLFYDEDIIQREKVCYMVRHHMTLHHILDLPNKTDKRLIKLSHGIVPVKYMLWLNEADSMGSINDIETPEFVKYRASVIRDMSKTLSCYTQPYSHIEKSRLIASFIKYNGKFVNETNNFTAYILCGFPGCGKSTYIKKHLEGIKVISRDVIRCELGINGATIENNKKVVGTQEEEKKVGEIFNQRMIECCENGESFVLDNTNLKASYRKDYISKIIKYNPLIKIIYIEAPNFIEDCYKRRENVIPTSVYKRMNHTFDFPQLYECNMLKIIKQQDNGCEEIYSFCTGGNISNGSLLKEIIDDLKITKGAMLLDGYECEDSCIKFMDTIIEKYMNKQ